MRCAFKMVGRITDLAPITYIQSHPNADVVRGSSLPAYVGRFWREGILWKVEGGRPLLVSSAKMNGSRRDKSTTTDGARDQKDGNCRPGHMDPAVVEKHVTHSANLPCLSPRAPLCRS